MRSFIDAFLVHCITLRVRFTCAWCNATFMHAFMRALLSLQVGHAFAVKPDKRLAKEAEERGWTVVTDWAHLIQAPRK